MNLFYFFTENKSKDIEKQDQIESSLNSDPDKTPNVTRTTRSLSNIAPNQMPEVIVN